jgi:omega-hydroxy-beta-dihydromenaquinone-9 sulfotransferase
LYEIRFNELETQPIKSLEKMYSKLNISDFNNNKTLFKTYLETVKGYKKNQLIDIPNEVKDQINKRWKFAFENWKYEIVD